MRARHVLLALSLLACAAYASAGAARSSSGRSEHLERLDELFDTIRTTHGGPAYISGKRLEQVRRGAEDLLSEAEADEDGYLGACAWAMRQLLDPLASHLGPSQAVEARERFHGRACLGLKLRVCLVPASAPLADGGADSKLGGGGSGASWFPRWKWWERRGWRRAALVSEVAVGSPAERAGICEGDELLEVDDPNRSVGWRLLRAYSLRDALRDHGPEGSAVRLTLRSQRSQRRAAIKADKSEGDGGRPWGCGRTVCLHRVAQPPPTVCSRPIARGRAQLVVISSFGATTADELRAALRELRKRERVEPQRARTLVFDLRGNEGGLLPEAIAACRMLIPSGGHVVSLRKEAPPRVAKAYRKRWYHRSELPSHLSRTSATRMTAARVSPSSPPSPPSPPYGKGASLVVLVNGASASSAEVFAGALAHAAGALVVGTRTYGKGSSQAVVYQHDGCAASFTAYTLSVGRREGRHALDGVGVEPHVPWRWRAPRAVRAADDAEVERALAAVGIADDIV